MHPINHWKRSFTLTCLCAVLTAGSLAAAQMAMGNAYARGDGVEKNPQLAQEWYDKARISPAMTYTRDTSSSPEWPQQALTDGQGHTVYERGRVRPGDKTKNAPEIIPQGQRVSYTYEGFTVSFILPANGQPQPAD
ncbi:SEL1-like repeat protein [uncultured Megasphaera sp.]|uniref:SEL1-like repeat protein n=1 Tax=uncultured Megasphaera sp. TaxID=165188 RepID=UPI002635A558|nr:SEL1-like repeat protein [uncultured Megasphaera sp.]